MRVFLLRIVAAKELEEPARRMVSGASDHGRHGERTAHRRRADRRRALHNRRQVLVLAAHAGTIGVNLDPHTPPRGLPLLAETNFIFRRGRPRPPALCHPPCPRAGSSPSTPAARCPRST